ncbi:MAG: ChbG/HpnK family deacetylase [Xanthobacteraceae bacterium]
MATDRSSRPAVGGAADLSAHRTICLCADDYGISASVNTAIRDLAGRKRISATSVMVVAPSFHRSEATALSLLNSDEKRVAIGLHLTLTAPFKPLSVDFAPLKNDAFPPLAAMLVYACLGRLRRAALSAEIAAQFRMFFHTFGRPPDFVDGHQHVHLFPQVRDALLAQMKEAAPDAWVRQCGRVGTLSERIGDRKGLLLDVLSKGFRERAEAVGVRTNPAFAGTYQFDDDANFAEFFPRFLDRLPDGGVIMCHPGFVDSELQRLDPLTTLREREYAYLAGEAFPALLGSRGVTIA